MLSLARHAALASAVYKDTHTLTMSRSTAKSLANWLHAPSRPLGALLSHVQLLRRFSAFLRDRLPPSLAAQCQAANIEGTTLVIAVSSSAWAAKLRYQIATLAAQLKKHDSLPPIEHIRIRVQPPRLEAARRPPHRLPMSTDTAALISQVADHTTDSALRESLRRLVRHASRRHR